MRPSRRTVVRSTAWTVPVIAVAATAPAYAASPCDVTAYRLDWDQLATSAGTTTWSRTDYRSGTATVTAPTSSEAGLITVGFASTWINETNGAAQDRRDQDLNLTISSTGNIGRLSPTNTAQGKALYIRHETPISGARTRRQQIVITFSRPVTGLNFTISDIDSTSGQYWDRVELTAANAAGGNVPYTANSSAAGISGSGGTSGTNAWQQTNNNTSFEADENGGNVPVSFASTASVKSLTLAFWSAQASGQQAIYLSDMSFSAKGC